MNDQVNQSQKHSGGEAIESPRAPERGQPNFTLGPWLVADSSYDRGKGDEGPRWDVHVPHRETIADVYREADARLIAAAPALYDALVDLVRQLPNDERLADFNLDHAEAALALAKGDVPATEG